MKKFALIVIDGRRCNLAKTFNTFKEAQAEMKKRYEEIISNYDDEFKNNPERCGLLSDNAYINIDSELDFFIKEIEE